MCQLKYHSIFPHFLQDSSSFIRYPEFASQSLKFCFKGASTAASTVPTTGSTAQSSSQSPPDITSTVSTPESTHNPTQTTTTVIATDTTHTSTVSTPGAPTQGPSSTTTPDSGGKHMCFYAYVSLLMYLLGILHYEQWELFSGTSNSRLEILALIRVTD